MSYHSPLEAESDMWKTAAGSELDCDFRFLLDYVLCSHGNFDVRSHFAVQLDGHRCLAYGLERLDELDLAAVNLEALDFEFVSNVG